MASPAARMLSMSWMIAALVENMNEFGHSDGDTDEVVLTEVYFSLIPLQNKKPSMQGSHWR